MEILSSWGIPLLVVLAVAVIAYGIAQLTMRWLDGQEELAKDGDERE
jgi:hypothetical protein